MKFLILDIEAIDNKPSAVVLDVAAIIFDPFADDKFTDIVSNQQNIFYRKFVVQTQVKDGRSVGKSTLEWWMKQSPEAKAIVRPSANDIELSEGLNELYTWLMSKDFNMKFDRAFSRGPSFDFSILSDASQALCEKLGVGYAMFPCAFWNQMDTRSFVRGVLIAPDVRKVPIAKSKLDGFIPHNSVHDVGKDIILIQTAIRYAKGEEELPEADYEEISV